MSDVHPFLTSSGEIAIAIVFAASALATAAVLAISLWRRRASRRDSRAAGSPG